MSDTARSRDGQDVALAYTSFREAILSGQIRPGETITQQQVADRIGVSRTPLREAIRILQHEGLVKTEPNRRLQIAEFSIEDVETLYVMRVLLECAAVRMTVPQISPHHVAELKGFMAQMAHYAKQPEITHEWEIPHRAFHAMLVAAAAERMTTSMRQLSDHAERYRRAYLETVPSSYEISDTEHRLIVDAAGERDTDRAAGLLAQHYLRTAESVIHEIDPSHDPTKLKLAARLVGVRAADAAIELAS
jgi:DNA-binding GntR family transcriptional regulator